MNDATQMTETAWQDIATAPRDKTTVALLWVSADGRERKYGVGWWMPMDGWQCWKGPEHAPYAAPTHWFALPKPPVTP